ncbi:MAG: hypothetical protein U0575_10170 [Phycisphaerales bacterium]
MPAPTFLNAIIRRLSGRREARPAGSPAAVRPAARGNDADVAPGAEWRTGNPAERKIDEAIDFTIRNVQTIIGFVGNDPAALRGKTFLEIGPGMDLGICLCVAGLGGSAIALDRFLCPWDATLHPPIYSGLERAAMATWAGFDPEPMRECVRRGAHAGPRLRALPVGLEDAHEIADGTVDLSYSNATFEHLADAESSIRSLARISRAGSRGFHQTDFRDHRNMDRPLEFLTIPDAEFAALLAECEHSCGNRVRPREFLRFFAEHGFDATFKPNMQAGPEYIADVRPRLLPRYAALPDTELAEISGRFFTTRRADDRGRSGA